MISKKVECKCQTCSNEPNGYKVVSKATRTRHRARDRKQRKITTIKENEAEFSER